MEEHLQSKMRAMKETIDKETNDKLRSLESKMTQLITTEISKHNNLSAQATQQKIDHLTKVVREEISSTRTQPGPNNQLAVKQSAELALVIEKKVEKNVLAKVEKIYGPRIEKVSEWVQYNTQDTVGLVNDYRMGVCGIDKNTPTPLITNGATGSKYKTTQFGPYTQFAFGDDFDDQI